MRIVWFLNCIQKQSHSSEDCEVCCENAKHHLVYMNARIEYHKPCEPGFVSYTADMQKVCLIPQLTTKEHVFVSRLVVFNETFASLNKGREDILVLWHEAISGRKATDVASAFVKCIKEAKSSKILFWADNCGGQNKNWFLYQLMVQVVACNWGPDVIIFKYLQRGHTYMAADSIHGNIGTKMKKQGNIFDFSDFSKICQNAKKNLSTVHLTKNDIFTFSKQVKMRSNEMPLLSDIVEIKFCKGSMDLLYKNSFTEDTYSSVDFLHKKFDKNVFPDSLVTERGITSKKKEDIIKLLRVAPEFAKEFWLNIPLNETVVDLMCNRDLQEPRQAGGIRTNHPSSTQSKKKRQKK